MNVTPKEKQIHILAALVEGNSIRSTERMTGVHRDTIMRLLVRIGKKCEAVSDKHIKDFHCHRLEADEIWTFVHKKEQRLRGRERLNPEIGDQFVYVALEPETKLVPTYLIGKRNVQTTFQFIKNLKKKLNGNGRIQLTTDGFGAYINAIELVFGADIDYAQLIKVFASSIVGPGRYAPPHVAEIISNIIIGNPLVEHVCTSYVERQNLSMRMEMRRFTRLTNAFSKKLENLKAAVSLHFWHYNFKRIHRTLKCTPAMEAGIADHVWEWDELVGLSM